LEALVLVFEAFALWKPKWVKGPLSTPGTPRRRIHNRPPRIVGVALWKSRRSPAFP